jgi:hypothetical protein
MSTAKVPQNLRRDLFKDLIQKLHEMQKSLAKDKSVGNIVVIKTAGTLPDDKNQTESWWANELHPTMKGFQLIADKKLRPS